MHDQALVLVFYALAALAAYIVCDDVDPSNQNSILLGQLRLAEKQLAVQQRQLELQAQQLELQRRVLERMPSESGWVRVLEYIVCVLLGYICIRVVRYCWTRYRRRAVTYSLPEMPQTENRARPLEYFELERLKLLTQLKSPGGSMYFDTPSTSASTG